MSDRFEEYLKWYKAWTQAISSTDLTIDDGACSDRLDGIWQQLGVEEKDKLKKLGIGR